LYITLVVKAKLVMDEKNPFDKKFVFTPRNIEMSQMKMLKGSEEMTSEAMMIQSMVNI
jgi:hypothetical protein